uniref:Conserved plasma membrane protein n=1 Tax=Rhabditophanes sp. KR3021 TaxID=114890 RepID=A0AC35TXN4_9BILA
MGTNPCCCRLKDGSISISIWSLIYSIAQLGIFGWQLAAIKYEKDRAANNLLPNYNTYGRFDVPSYYESYWQSPEERYYVWLFVIQVICLITSIALMLSSVSLIYGIHTISRCLIAVWFPCIIGSMLFSLAYCIMWWCGDVRDYWVVLTIIEMIGVIINIYCLVVILAFYHRIGAERKVCKIKYGQSNLDLQYPNHARINTLPRKTYPLELDNFDEDRPISPVNRQSIRKRPLPPEQDYRNNIQPAHSDPTEIHGRYPSPGPYHSQTQSVPMEKYTVDLDIDQLPASAEASTMRDYDPYYKKAKPSCHHRTCPQSKPSKHKTKHRHRSRRRCESDDSYETEITYDPSYYSGDKQSRKHRPSCSKHRSSSRRRYQDVPTTLTAADLENGFTIPQNIVIPPNLTAGPDGTIRPQKYIINSEITIGYNSKNEPTIKLNNNTLDQSHNNNQRTTSIV